jgi:5-hydroxyisourate hydrolase
MNEKGITTHVLDTSRGLPASGVPILLEFQEEKGWRELSRAETDAAGRQQLLPCSSLTEGVYRLTFGIETYFRAQGVEGFYPEAAIVFHVREVKHHHVPLLLSPYGYSTYRGS